MRESLEQNKDKLITTYDLHKTLQHAAIYPKEIDRSSSKRQSLFYPLDTYRNCTEAGIPEDICICSEWQYLSSKKRDQQKEINEVVKSSIDELNRLTLNGQSVCLPLTIAGEPTVSKSENKEKGLAFYRLVYTTKNYRDVKWRATVVRDIKTKEVITNTQYPSTPYREHMTCKATALGLPEHLCVCKPTVGKGKKKPL